MSISHTRDQLRLKLFGEPVRVFCNSDDHAYLRAAWSRCADECADDENPSEPIEAFESNADPARILRALTAIAIRSATATLMLRGAAVADHRGNAWALLGSTDADRQAAIRALSIGDYGYVCDGIVAYGQDGHVQPLERPFVIRDAASGPRLVGPDELGLRRCLPPLRLTKLVVLHRSRRSSQAVVDRDLIQGAVALVSMLLLTASHPRALIEVCRLIERCGGVLHVTYSSPDEIASLIVNADDDSTTVPNRWSPVGAPPLDQDSARWGIMDGRVRQVPYRDAIRTDDEGLVLVGSTPVRLSALGLTIWEAAEAAPTLAELTELIVEVHGPHPEAARLISDAVRGMSKSQVIGYAPPRPLSRLVPEGGPKPVKWVLRRKPGDS